MPEFPFPGWPDPQQFFFLQEQDLQHFQCKKEEEIDTANQMFFYQPEMMYGLPEAVSTASEWQEPVEKTCSTRTPPPRHPPRLIPYLHTKQVGTLSLEERRAKIEKYLQKRSRRTFGKKVFYACRKRVADTRLRVKGRFVTKKMAEKMRSQDIPSSS